MRRKKLYDPLDARRKIWKRLMDRSFKGCIPIHVTKGVNHGIGYIVTYWIHDNEYVGSKDAKGYCSIFSINNLVASRAIDENVISAAKVGDVRPVRLPLIRRRRKL